MMMNVPPTKFARTPVQFSAFLLYFIFVLGVFAAVACFGILFLLLIDPCIRRRRETNAALVAARYNRDNDRAVLLSSYSEGGYTAAPIPDF